MNNYKYFAETLTRATHQRPAGTLAALPYFALAMISFALLTGVYTAFWWFLMKPISVFTLLGLPLFYYGVVATHAVGLLETARMASACRTHIEFYMSLFLPWTVKWNLDLDPHGFDNWVEATVTYPFRMSLASLRKLLKGAESPPHDMRLAASLLFDLKDGSMGADLSAINPGTIKLLVKNDIIRHSHTNDMHQVFHLTPKGERLMHK